MEACLPLQLTVRGLDPAIVAALKHRAAEHGRSMEAEHRELLREALAPGRKDFWERADAIRSRTPWDGNSADLIREDRDSR
jgi:plasmid stability protein